MTDLDDTFAKLGIAPERLEHPPVATVEEARAHWARLDAEPVKNLFLKDEAGRFWLVAAAADTAIELKALRHRIGSKRLRFASADDLQRLLGIAPGAVSPLALINDVARAVTLVLDAKLTAASRLAVHPLRNTATLALPPRDLLGWLASIGRAPPLIVDVAGDGA